MSPNVSEIDVDAIRRIALCAVPLGGAGGGAHADNHAVTHSGTLMTQMDALIEHPPLGRVLVLAQALAELIKVDAGALETFRRAGLAAGIRSEVSSRKTTAQAAGHSAQLADPSLAEGAWVEHQPLQPLVARAQLIAPANASGHG